jgi:DNA-binding TFAR19-related protein (PDSD5 family)
MFKIVDQAIRKEISWHEARARLHDLVIEEPDLFAAVDTQIVQDLREDQGAD